MSNYAHPEVLVDTQWVAEHLNDPKVRIVELGYDTSDYVSGHIPGALGWGWSTDFQHPIRKDLPDKEGIEELLKTIRLSSFMALVVTDTRHSPYGF